MKWRTAGAAGAGLVAVLAATGGVVFQQYEVGSQMAIFTGAAAKMMCSNVFLSGRSPEHVLSEDFARLTSPGSYIQLADVEVDFEQKTATATLFGFAERTAIYREGLGCTTAEGKTVEELREQGSGIATSLPPPDPNVQWPEGDATLIGSLPTVINADALKYAVDFAFTDADPEQPKRTRGVAVVYGGRIVAERYAPGFDKTTMHLSNSVAKSFTSALIGILVGQGKLKVDTAAPIPEWHGAEDPRRVITLDNLLRMSSGLEFEENYVKMKSDTTFQYVGGDLAGYVAAKPLQVAPGTRWQYSTGTSNILGRIVREAAGPSFADGFAFPRRVLFEPLGMRNTVLEVDAAGNFVGGSSIYASVRDYARFGLLYLRDGVWNGQRILPEGWVAYTTTPTAHVPKGGYGAQFWLNEGTEPDVLRWPNLPRDTFAMNGHQGQHVFMVPSRDLVVVRVGLSEFRTWDMADLVEQVLKALPGHTTATVN